LDIFPNARKRLNASPVDTDTMVRVMVTLAPSRSGGSHLIILPMISMMYFAF